MSELIGYARTSTFEQDAGLEAQLRVLEQLKCKRIFFEKVSSVDKDERGQLEEALRYIRDGDTFVVTKLDRLARSMKDLISIVEKIEVKGASLRVLAMNLDTSTPTGRLMLNVLGSVAQFEREIMLERQREGIAKAKANGAYKGRKATARAKSDDVFKLAADGIGPVEIAKRLQIGRSSVHRILTSHTSR